jgi:hypothetical protein
MNGDNLLSSLASFIRRFAIASVKTKRAVMVREGIVTGY